MAVLGVVSVWLTWYNYLAKKEPEVKALPNIKSAMKRVKVSNKKHAANSSQKSALRKQIKSARLAIESSAADAAEKVKTATVALDVAASKGLIHKNKAARDKSRLMTALNKMA